LIPKNLHLGPQNGPESLKLLKIVNCQNCQKIVLRELEKVGGHRYPPGSIEVILNLPPPKLVRQLREILGHTCYYWKFIKGYAQITGPMEKLLTKDRKF
jgi:hypothetical protein